MNNKKYLAIELGRAIFKDTINNQQEKIDELEKKLADAVEIIKFSFDNVNHEKGCRYPSDECFCMDRTFYNDARVYDKCLWFLEEKEAQVNEILEFIYLDRRELASKIKDLEVANARLFSDNGNLETKLDELEREYESCHKWNLHWKAEKKNLESKLAKAMYVANSMYYWTLTNYPEEDEEYHKDIEVLKTLKEIGEE